MRSPNHSFLFLNIVQDSLSLLYRDIEHVHLSNWPCFSTGGDHFLRGQPAVPLAVTYTGQSKGRQAMYEESSSEKYPTPFKKCFIDDQLQPLKFKKPKESNTPNGELITDEDLLIIVAKLQISVEES
ncbi:hypothetical protein L2E82_49263 [Cichorium intybus]|uniref:Uncharacterized protein n=1 Tax=Cichorium intybus TaxID=13427 RepID=A0ACB8YZ87_CICIN|nr:hypothetical protein L2E82_49263 [Cichorium intybus]